MKFFATTLFALSYFGISQTALAASIGQETQVQSESGWPENCRAVAERIVQNCGGITGPELFKFFSGQRPLYFYKDIYWYRFQKRENGKIKTCTFMLSDHPGWRCDTYDSLNNKSCGSSTYIRGCK